MGTENALEPRTFGELLKTARENAKMTQTQLAAIMHTTTRNLQRWEHDEADVRASTLARLCDALDVEPNYFFGYSTSQEHHPRLTQYRDKINQMRRILI